MDLKLLWMNELSGNIQDKVTQLTKVIQGLGNIQDRASQLARNR